MRATASSAASIRISWCRGSNWRPSWCSNFAAASRRRSIVAGDARAIRARHRLPASSEVKRLAGLDVPLAEMKRILAHLGFFVAGQGESVKVAVPSWRPDVEGKADIVEEIVRIVGVDRVPFDAVRSRRGAAQAGAHADPGAHPQGQARARRARHGRGGDLVVHRQAAGRIVRRRQARACARQSDRGRPLRHAAEPHSRPRRGGAEQRRSRIRRCGAVRGRADFRGRPAGGSVHRGSGRAARPRQGECRRTPLVASGASMPMPSTPRRMRSRRSPPPARR